VPFLATDPSPFLPRFPKAISYETMVLLLTTNPSPCLQVPQSNFLSNLGAIPGNKFLHHYFKVPENNFL
jgi:hypothetical protein